MLPREDILKLKNLGVAGVSRCKLYLVVLAMHEKLCVFWQAAAAPARPRNRYFCSGSSAVMSADAGLPVVHMQGNTHTEVVHDCLI